MKASNLSVFENIVRKAKRYTTQRDESELHPFEERNISEELYSISMDLFDNAHYSQATFESFKYLDILVQNLSKESESGYKLMMKVFSETKPKLKLNNLSTSSEIDEQMGYKMIFAGGMSGIRNPRGHEFRIKDDIDLCLDHLAFVSMLLRKIREAGHK